MNQKHCLLVMALAGVLSLAPLPAFSGNLSNFSDALEQLADPRRFGYGQSRYDHDRDKWKGVPPGLAKKGGLPPGQAKKFKEHHDKKHRD